MRKQALFAAPLQTSAPARSEYAILIFREIFTDDLPDQRNWSSFDVMARKQGSLDLGKH